MPNAKKTFEQATAERPNPHGYPQRAPYFRNATKALLAAKRFPGETVWYDQGDGHDRSLKVDPRDPTNPLRRTEGVRKRRSDRRSERRTPAVRFKIAFATERGIRFEETGDYLTDPEHYADAAEGELNCPGATPLEIDGPRDALNIIYRLAQNGPRAWGERPEVLEVHTRQLRSLSVGDVIELQGEGEEYAGAFEVAGFGFTRLEAPASEAPA